MEGEYPVEDYLDVVRRREEERRERWQEAQREQAREARLNPKCKKCQWTRTADRTGVCWRCKQAKTSRKPQRKPCKKCQTRTVIYPRVVCWVCRLPEKMERVRRQRVEQKVAEGQCAGHRCRNRALPGSTTCIRHGGYQERSA
jgi:hypothetical protein